MLDSTRIWKIATRLPRVFSGKVLHHRGLMAAHRGEATLADRLFECAAARYRQDLSIESLARLRVHQLMVRVRSLRNPDREAEMSLEVERLLKNLRRIETLEPPFVVVDAHSLLAGWLAPSGSGDQRTGTDPVALAA